MNWDIALEIFGYIGSVLVVISMMMTSITKLRIVNISGSVISTTYSVIVGAWPIVAMNVALMIINFYHIFRDEKNKRAAVVTPPQENACTPTAGKDAV